MASRKRVNGPLTYKQAQFAHEYLVDVKACRAALRAGNSAKTAKRIGCFLAWATAEIKVLTGVNVVERGLGLVK